MKYKHKEDVNQKVEGLDSAIKVLTDQLNRLGELRSEYMNQLLMQDLSDPEELPEDAKHILKMIAQTTVAMRALSTERRQVRSERSRLRGQFLFTHEEIDQLIDLLNQAIEEDPTSDVLHSIYEQLDEIEGTAE